MNHYLVAAVWLLVGAAAGYGQRHLSVWLARLEELEPGFRPWQVWGPVIVTAALFAAFGWRLGATLTLLIVSLWVWVLVQVIFFDLEHRLILDHLMFPSYAAALILSIWTPHLGWKQALITGVVAGAVFLALAVLGALFFRAEVLGMGDVKLAVFLGLVLGFSGTLNALLLGVILAGVISIALIVVRVKRLKDTIAYGPYLAAGALIILFNRG
ncbi:MAG TPA: A24 family peptidase [Candidatus Dormibacteraeota bacterium]